MADINRYEGPPIMTDFSHLVGHGTPARSGGSPRTGGSGTPAADTAGTGGGSEGAAGSASETTGSSGSIAGNSGGAAGSASVTVSKGAVTAIAIMAIVVIACVIFVATKLSGANNADAQPSTEPVATSDANQTPATQSSVPASDNNEPVTANSDDQFFSGDGDDAEPDHELGMAEQAARLDAWFEDVPESFLDVKTTAELGVDTETPLGEFCAYFCAILPDGTVVTRGRLEEGHEALPTVVTDYAVPAKWHNNMVILDVTDTDLALVVTAKEFAKGVGQEINGAVWEWNSETNAYEYSGMGTTSLT